MRLIRIEFDLISQTLLLVGLLFPLAALAHGPLHEQIQRLTHEIAQFPDSAGLYLQRAELHRHHQDWREALSDYDHAKRLAPTLALIELCRGKMYLDAQQPKLAKAALNRFLAKSPADGEGFLTRARALAQLEEFAAAADDFRRAIENMETPQPEYYFERARALVADNRVADALRSVDEGMQRLGQIVTLQVYAIDLEIRLQRYDQALVRVDKVAAQSPRKEKWLARRGEILLMAGREDEARQAYRQALQEIESLSAQRRSTKAVVDLEKLVRAALGT